MGKGNVPMKLKDQHKAVTLSQHNGGLRGSLSSINSYQHLSGSTSGVNVFLSYLDHYEGSQPDAEYKI